MHCQTITKPILCPFSVKTNHLGYFLKLARVHELSARKGIKIFLTALIDYQCHNQSTANHCKTEPKLHNSILYNHEHENKVGFISKYENDLADELIFQSPRGTIIVMDCISQRLMRVTRTPTLRPKCCCHTQRRITRAPALQSFFGYDTDYRI